VVVSDRRTDPDFLHRPVERTVGVTQGDGAECAGDEYRGIILGTVDISTAAAERIDAVTVQFVQIDGCTESQTIVGFARQAERDVDVVVELSAIFDGQSARVVITHTADNTDLGIARQRNFCSSDASGGDKCSRCKENFFHFVFPRFFQRYTSIQGNPN